MIAVAVEDFLLKMYASSQSIHVCSSLVSILFLAALNEVQDSISLKVNYTNIQKNS
jgi:hypothetical protein